MKFGWINHLYSPPHPSFSSLFVLERKNKELNFKTKAFKFILNYFLGQVFWVLYHSAVHINPKLKKILVS